MWSHYGYSYCSDTQYLPPVIEEEQEEWEQEEPALEEEEDEPETPEAPEEPLPTDSEQEEEPS